MSPFLEERTQHFSPFLSSLEPAALVNRANEALQVTEVVLERRFIFLASARLTISRRALRSYRARNQAFAASISALRVVASDRLASVNVTVMATL